MINYPETKVIIVRMMIVLAKKLKNGPSYLHKKITNYCKSIYRSPYAFLVQEFEESQDTELKYKILKFFNYMLKLSSNKREKVQLMACFETIGLYDYLKLLKHEKNEGLHQQLKNF
jgi:hypothetical protein